MPDDDTEEDRLSVILYIVFCSTRSGSFGACSQGIRAGGRKVVVLLARSNFSGGECSADLFRFQG